MDEFTKPPDAYVVSAYDVPLRENPMLRGRWARVVDGSGRGLIVAAGRLAAGEDSGWHDHPEDEAFIVLAGRGIVRWRLAGDEHEHPVEPGAVFYKRGGISHSMQASADGELVGIGCKV